MDAEEKEEGTNAPTVESSQLRRSATATTANRKKIVKLLGTISDKLTSAAPESFMFSDEARQYPDTPGEEHLSRNYHHHVEQYDVLRRQPSRAASFNGSIASRPSIEGSPTTPRANSPPEPRSPRSASPFSLPSAPRRPRTSTFPVEQRPSEQRNPGSSASAGSIGIATQQRRDTLEVPSPTRLHHSHTRNHLSISATTSTEAALATWSPPAIVVFSEPDTISPLNTPSLDSPITPSHSEPLRRPSAAALPPSL